MAVLNISWSHASPVPSNGYEVGYREQGSSTYSIVSPNSTGNSIQITVPDGKAWEGYVQSDCNGTKSTRLYWKAKDPRSCTEYYNNTGNTYTVSFMDCFGVQHTDVDIPPGQDICADYMNGGEWQWLTIPGNCYDNGSII